MTTLDLDALERAARAAICGDPMINARERAAGRIALKESATPEAILSLFSAVRALQERVEGAEKALRQAESMISYPVDRRIDPDGFGLRPTKDIRFGVEILRAARTKAGEPHEQE